MWTVKYISFGKQPVAARPQGSGLAVSGEAAEFYR